MQQKIRFLVLIFGVLLANFLISSHVALASEKASREGNINASCKTFGDRAESFLKGKSFEGLKIKRGKSKTEFHSTGRDRKGHLIKFKCVNKPHGQGSFRSFLKVTVHDASKNANERSARKLLQHYIRALKKEMGITIDQPKTKRFPSNNTIKQGG